MAKLTDIVDYADQLLNIRRFSDYCPNGLQIEGASQVTKIASAVTASLSAVEQAADWGAQVLLVHHGYFWKSEPAVITGMKQKRIRTFMQADMSLLAYHLPLDAHPEVGNNAQLGMRMGIHSSAPLFPEEKASVGQVGELDEPADITQWLAKIETVLGRKVQHIEASHARIQKIAWCTGAAQQFIEQAVTMGADVYLSGEISEQTVHVARECGIHYVAAGHHATERYGVQALGSHLADRFALQHQYLEIENPV